MRRRRNTGATFVDLPDDHRRELRLEPEVLSANLRAYGDDRDIDRLWFKAHPQRTMYVRPATKDEMRIAPLSAAVLVIQVKRGRRYRQHLIVQHSEHVKAWCESMGEQQCRDLAQNVLSDKAREIIQRLAA